MALKSVVLFCSDPYVMARFWAEALDAPPVDEDATALRDRSLEDGESVLLRGPGLDVWVTPVERLDAVGNRVHLDVHGDAATVERLLALGGTRVRDQADWVVLADPEGNHLCVVPGRGA